MNHPWMKFYPADWRADPGLRMCSIAARGMWMEMLCLMHEAAPRGFLTIGGRPPSRKQLASLCGVSSDEADKLLQELEECGVFSVTDDGVIFSRRILRDEEKVETNKKNGLEGGNPFIRRGTVPKERRVRPFKRSDAPKKTRRIFERAGGKCHWCSVDLLFSGSGSERNLFHVDHVLPVCDGGTNDERNLVAACADCNRRRARVAEPTITHVVGVGYDSDSNSDHNSDHNSDPKAQKPEARGQTSGREGRDIWVGGESSPTVVQGETVGGRAVHEDVQPATAQIIPLSATLRDGVERRQAAGPTAMAVKSPAEARGRHSQSSGLTDSGGAESAAGGTSEAILSDAPVAADGGAA